MVETTTTTTRESRLGYRRRQATPADATIAKTSGAPFWMLMFVLVLGIGIALVLAFRGYSGPGLFTQSEALTATGVALFVMACVLLVFLGTIGFVFGQVRKLRFEARDAEDRRLEDVIRQEAIWQQQEADMQQLRNEVAALRQRETVLRQREQVLASELGTRRAFAKGAREGDAHVVELEGIGPLYATRLNKLGIITVNQLVQAEPVALARHIEATPEQVKEWQAMGRLLAVKGIGPQWAEALARIGVTGPADLAQREAGSIAAAIAHLTRSGTRVTGSDPSPAVVARWIRAAGGRATARATRRQGLRPARRRSVRSTVR